MTDAERAEIVDIVALVPAFTLLDVVRENRVIADFEDLRKRTTSDEPDQARLQVIGAVVDRYAAMGKTELLLHSLYERSYRDRDLTQRLLPHLEQFKGDEAKRRALAERANTLPGLDLEKFLIDVKAMVCIIVAVDGTDGTTVLGTGFLVAPSRVLTAFHTLKRHIVNEMARESVRGDKMFALFDHYKGNPIDGDVDEHPGLLKVPFARHWLHCCCEDMPRDGLFLSPDPDQLSLLPKRLDFALIELAEPVGSLNRPQSGGLPRSWIKLADATNNLRNDDRIIIPQHPHGWPQRIDFGRYSDADSELDTSSTRIRYNTEADQGASGSPCFNQNFRLVGMHNAAFMPDGVAIRKNQAIRADCIRARIDTIGLPPLPSVAPAPWTTSTDPASPRPILGRRAFFDWLSLANRDPALDRGDRIYAVVSDAAKSGKSFTAEILVAARRGLTDAVVSLGNREELPPTVVDFVRVLGYLLRIPESELGTLPPRPDIGLPRGSADGDKLRKWASDEVPAWFGDVLGRHRVRTVDRWGIAWILLDGLDTRRMSEEVRDLVAGLIGVNIAESQLNTELARLRWIFLGQVPDFLPAEDVTLENLDPGTLGADDLVRTIGRMLESYGKEFNFDRDAPMIRALVAGSLDQSVARLNDPATRLETLQGVARQVALAFQQLLGIRT
jgi:hypothetical protein